MARREALMTRDVVLVLLALAAGAAWCGWAWWWPYTYCRRCVGRKGQGRGASKFGWNRCRRCGGKGEQVRHTARVISKLTGRPVRGSEES